MNRRGAIRILLAVLLCTWGGMASGQGFNVTFLHTPASQAVEGRDLTISGNIIGADQVSIAALAFRVSGQGDFEIRELRLVNGDYYEGVIPGKAVKPPAVEYYCYAVDWEGNRHVIFASESQPQKVTVGAPKAAATTGGGKKPEKKPTPGGEKPKPEKEPSAQGLEESLAIFGVEDVVQVATRNAVKVGEAPAIVSAVTREQIEAMGAQTVADVLDQVPGIHVTRSVSGVYRLAVRGVQSDPEVLVLLDGHRINDLYDGNAVLEFPAEAVERVEIIRGPGSALYGTGAFVGVVNIITRRSTAIEGRAAYGLFNTARVSAGGGYDSDAFYLGGQLQFVFSQGQDRHVASDVLSGVIGALGPKNDQGQSQDVSNTPGSVDDHRTQLHAQLQGSMKNLGKGELALQAHYFFQTRGAFVGKFDSLDRGSDLSLHMINTDISYKVPLSKMITLDSKIYYDTHLVENAFQVIRAGDNAYIAGDKHLTDGLRETNDYRTETIGLEASANFKLLDTNTLITGLQAEYLSLPTFTLDRSASGVSCDEDTNGNQYLAIQGFQLPCGLTRRAGPTAKSRMVFGLYAQDQWNELVKGLELLAGFRLDYFTDFGITFNPRVGVVYAPIESLSLKVLYSKAFRAPTFQELYDKPDFDPLRTYTGDPKLSPVTINTLEAGIEARIETAPVEYRLRGNFFYNWIRDSIEPLDTGQAFPAYHNVESLDVMGTEVEGVARFGKRNRVFVNSSWFRAKVSSSGQSQESYITDVPQMLFNVGLDLAVFEWLNLHVGAQYASERRNNTRQQMEVLRSFKIPAYTVVNAGLSTEPLLFEHLVFFAHCTNVFDTDVRDPPPRPDHNPGLLPREPFSFLVGVGWRP